MTKRVIFRFMRLQVLATILAAIWLFDDGNSTAEPRTRPESWAVKVNRPGVPNLHKVNNGLYRGAQPTAQGIKELEKLGIKTIVTLRSSHSDRKLLGSSRIAIEAIPMRAWDDPTDGDVAKFLRIVTDKNRQPVFVHCQRGADRTGVMCAAYRVTVQGWTKRQAIEEMTGGDFGFNPMWSNLPKFVEDFDVEKTRAKAGLKTQ